MSRDALSPADALLRLWMLAAVALAGLYLWLAWRMRDWPGDGPAPQPLSTVAVAEFMALFIFVPAAIVVVMRWRATRDRPLAGLGLLYGLASAASVAAWAQADTAGMVQALFVCDAAIALTGVPVALRALRLG
ncbi:hypothetical protein [Sandarakinorhabdus sp. AAP62]|uniref:hypothetical protein n=1 Tax=Sandarakinorhabdus sp. AAP62 TaxID=1248916 RepID=UPI0003105FD9|nr:hypothetical protein [Sandarakinorhabdus sp. AAP62]